MILQRFFSFKLTRLGLPLFSSYPSRSIVFRVVTERHSHTRVSTVDGVRRITLCNVKERNALSLNTMQEILQHLTHEEDDPNLRAIVFDAEGPVFSSGHNLKELKSSDGQLFHVKVFELCSQLMERMIQSPVPVIVAVNGLAAAAGCQLVAQCDIAVCTENSTFSTPGAKFGIFCSTPGVAVVRSVKRKVAAHMLFTGLAISSEEAVQAGLVSKVVSTDKLEEELDKITTAIKAQSRSVITLGKRFFYQQVEKDVISAYRLGTDVMVKNLALFDGQEGIKSFMEKRKPHWGHTFDKA